jgi:hypothetical protein
MEETRAKELARSEEARRKMLADVHKTHRSMGERFSQQSRDSRTIVVFAGSRSHWRILIFDSLIISCTSELYFAM